jgi:hypothetical protein
MSIEVAVIPLIFVWVEVCVTVKSCVAVDVCVTVAVESITNSGQYVKSMLEIEYGVVPLDSLVYHSIKLEPLRTSEGYVAKKEPLVEAVKFSKGNLEGVQTVPSAEVA